jgi:predicted methyltransferase
MSITLMIHQPVSVADQPQAEFRQLELPLPGKRSIVRLALPDTVTDTGRSIAQTLYDGLDKKDRFIIAEVVERLQGAIGKENIGGSYSALHWLAKSWLTANTLKPSDSVQMDNPLDQAFYDYFLSNDAINLKEYLQRKYAVSDYVVQDPENPLHPGTFLEDYLIFNNPSRETWDATSRVVEIVKGLDPPVQRIIDVGAGFGYFSQKFAESLGENAVVYAVDTVQTYVDHLRATIEKHGIKRIVPTLSTTTDVSVQDETDLVFISSLYHVLYAWTQPKQRDDFIASVKRSLRADGYLVILDNIDQSGASVHNVFLNQEFAIAQLYFYGFELVRSETLSPYRYLLVLRKAANEIPKPPVFQAPASQLSVRVSNADSLVHIGSLDSFDITPSGIAAASLLLHALSQSDLESARAAINIYENLIPTENFGGEYSALLWVAKYFAGSDEVKRAMTEERLAAEYLAYLSEDDFAKLKFYLVRKYRLEAPVITAEEATDKKTREIGIVRRTTLEDFILFNNPMRETWEKSSRILEVLPLRKGDTIVDLGSGPGYFTFKFSDIVGPDGAVYAMDTMDQHIEYLQGLATKWGLKNVHGSVSSTSGFELPDAGTADVVFMCSLYHNIYAVSSHAEREGMIESIRKALKPGGKFVVVDNGPVDEQNLPYHGPYIRPELIEAQLLAYGFKLESLELITPQRYLMIFTH